MLTINIDIEGHLISGQIGNLQFYNLLLHALFLVFTSQIMMPFNLKFQLKMLIFILKNQEHQIRILL